MTRRIWAAVGADCGLARSSPWAAIAILRASDSEILWRGIFAMHLYDNQGIVMAQKTCAAEQSTPEAAR